MPSPKPSINPTRKPLNPPRPEPAGQRQSPECAVESPGARALVKVGLAQECGFGALGFQGLRV